MATVVELPRLSDTMEEGVIARWRIKVGDKVKRGQVIAEIETDKATMEFESFDAGTVLKLIAGEGETLPIGAPIAVLGAPGEDPEGGAKPGTTAPVATAAAAKPVVKPAGAAGSSADVQAPTQAPGPEGPVSGGRSEKPARDDGRVPASPLSLIHI